MENSCRSWFPVSLPAWGSAHHFRHEESDRLAKHAGFRFNAAHASADHAESVDHGGMGVGAYEGVGVADSVFFEHAGGEVFKIDLVDDADAWRDYAESIECLLGSFEKFIALLVTDEFDGEIAIHSLPGSGKVDLNGVIHDKVNGNKWLYDRGIRASLLGGIAHSG